MSDRLDVSVSLTDRLPARLRCAGGGDEGPGAQAPGAQLPAVRRGVVHVRCLAIASHVHHLPLHALPLAAPVCYKSAVNVPQVHHRMWLPHVQHGTVAASSC